MNDWKKHLKVHLGEWKEFKHFDDKDMPKIAQVVSMILQGAEPERLNDDGDIDELKRLIALCEATDDERGGKQFAGNPIQRDTVIHVPLTRDDIGLIHFAIDDAIEKKITEIAQDYYRKKEKS